MSHRIRLEGAGLRFAAAHFATFRGECEPLHGHNYALVVEIGGELTEDAWVLDFSDGKRIAADLCGELDHKFILQRNSRELAVSDEAGSMEIRFRERRYVLPTEDVVSLPIDNSTAERLAEWFAGRLRAQLQELGARNVRSISVGVAEAPGQSAWFHLNV